MLIYGFHPVREALRHRPHEILRILIASGRGGPRRDEVENLARRHGVEIVPIAGGAIPGAEWSVHNGFAAELRASTADSQAVSGDPDFVVLVEDIQDPRNLGALLRVCEGAGVGRVLVRDRGSAPLSPTAAKAAAGAGEWLAVERVTNTASTLKELKEEGYWIYGAAGGGEAPWDIDLKGKVVLCFGGEEKGLRQLTREVCDRLVGLPMRGRVESLNLSTAAAAILYEAVRQRLPGKPPSR
jgi:23S rRNA (guanosine2251-2'-O)-methyltransferase